MSKSNDDDNRPPDRPTDVDRYERLQKSAERQFSRLDKAYERHVSLIKTSVVVIGTLIGILVAVAAWLFGKNLADFKTELRTSLADHLTSMTTRADSEFASMTNRLESQFSGLTNRLEVRISDEFRKDHVDGLIVQEITKVTNTIHKQIDPELEWMTNQLSSVGRLASMENDLQDKFSMMATNLQDLHLAQVKLDSVFGEMTNRLASVESGLSARLESARNTLDKSLAATRAKMESAVNDILSSPRAEIFSSSDTNRVMIQTFTNNERLLFVLKEVPLANTINGIKQDEIVKSQNSMVPLANVLNIAIANYPPDPNLQHATFVLTYARDSRVTNTFHGVTIDTNNDVYSDGALILSLSEHVRKTP